MFGRLRPPPSSPDCLEGYPAKIIKDDPLSVYESTLLKLKQGSRLDSSLETEDESVSHMCNGSDAMAIDTGSGGCEKSKEPKNNNNPSVLSMFCRYKNKTHTVYTKTEKDS